MRIGDWFLHEKISNYKHHYGFGFHKLFVQTICTFMAGEFVNKTIFGGNTKKYIEKHILPSTLFLGDLFIKNIQS